MNELTPVFGALICCVLTSVLGIFIVPFLKKLNFGQTILEDGPKWHSSKQGTPTMGGIMVIIGFVISLGCALCYSAFFGEIFSKNRGSLELSMLFATVWLALSMGAIGFLDDYIKVVKKRNLGLTAKQKTLFQLLSAASYLGILALSGLDSTWLPFIGTISVTKGFGLVFWPIALMFIYGFVNAVNLTDGLDGLASSVTMLCCCGLMLISGCLGHVGANTLAACAAGGCVGFLIWNAHPAKVFMGDTGSLFLGGLVVGIAFASGRPVLLILTGVVYLMEAFSVMLQVTYFKKTKKRLFKMSPIHHHFELSGYSEEKIVFLFSAITFLGVAIALVLVLFNI